MTQPALTQPEVTQPLMTKPIERVAFIGLGNMGLPMARNLVAAGFQVSGYDLSSAAREALAQAGGSAATSASAAIDGAHAVMTMLPASRHVKLLLLGDDGLLSRLERGTLLIDCSTIAAADAREVAAQARALGLAMLDAPVSGGTAGAAAGTLTFMVGGEACDVARAQPLLEHLGSRVLHAGASGAGQMAKACNNLMLGIAMIGACEALQLGVANGLDPGVLSDIMRNSSGASWVMNVYNPCPGVMDTAPAARGYSGGFGTDLMLKDLGLAEQAALDSGATVPLGSLARQLFQMHSTAGSGGLDFSSIYSMLSPRRDRRVR